MAFILFFILGVITSTQFLSFPIITEQNPNVINNTAMGLAASIIMGGGGILQILFGLFLGASDQNIDHFKYAFMLMLISFVTSFILSVFIHE